MSHEGFPNAKRQRPTSRRAQSQCSVTREVTRVNERVAAKRRGAYSSRVWVSASRRDELVGKTPVFRKTGTPEATCDSNSSNRPSEPNSPALRYNPFGSRYLALGTLSTPAPSPSTTSRGSRSSAALRARNGGTVMSILSPEQFSNFQSLPSSPGGTGTLKKPGLASKFRASASLAERKVPGPALNPPTVFVPRGT